MNMHISDDGWCHVLRRRPRALHLKVATLSSPRIPTIPQYSDGRVWIMVWYSE